MPQLGLNRKPIAQVAAETQQTCEDSQKYGLWDLVAVGIGSTLGSGVFTLVGQIAAQNAGPAAILSLAVGTIGVVLTGSSYVELSSQLPSSGSVYAYSYAGLGEVFAVIAAGGLTLEYGISAGAVAVTWGAKVAQQAGQSWLGGPQLDQPVAVAGLALVLGCGALLLAGVKESKLFTNTVTIAKVLVVIFLIVVAFVGFDAQNLTPFIQTPKGTSAASGILTGSLSSFFGFLGFDECCCLSGITRDSTKTMPKAVILSVLGTAVFTMLAAFALVAMVPSSDIDVNDGFVTAFNNRGWHWAGWIGAVGETVTLPVVVFVCLLPQSHLFSEMAKDGLLPPFFKDLSSRGVYTYGTLFTLALVGLITAFVDFDVLNDMISAGVLVSFVLASCSALMVREMNCGRGNSSTVARPLWSFVLGTAILGYAGTGLIVETSCIGSALANLKGGSHDSAVLALQIVSGLAGLFSLACFVVLMARVPGRSELPQMPYVTPGKAFLPCLSIAFNNGMIATLSFQGFCMVVGLFAIMLITYYGYGQRKAASLRQDRQEACDTSLMQRS